jgi:hypothetical protein
MTEKNERRPVVTGGAAGVDKASIDPTITETPAAAQAVTAARSGRPLDETRNAPDWSGADQCNGPHHRAYEGAH